MRRGSEVIHLDTDSLGASNLPVSRTLTPKTIRKTRRIAGRFYALVLSFLAIGSGSVRRWQFTLTF